MEKISWIDSLRQRSGAWSEGGVEYHTVKRSSLTIGHIQRKNYLLKHVIEVNIEGGIEVTGGRGRRRKLLLDYLK